MCPRVTQLETKPVGVRLILRRCVMAVGAAAAAVLLRAALDPLWGSKLPLLTFGGAVMVSAWFGGLWPGLLTTALCALAIDYFWMAPTGSLAAADTGGIVALALFLLIGLLISGLNEALHIARRRLEAAAREAEGHAAERLRAEEERNLLLVKERAARQEAEEANRAKDEFLAILSHELRTPLQSMLGWLALLRSGRLEARAARRALETIEGNTRTRAQLIGELLDVSRILAGKLRLDRRPVNLVRVVEAAIHAVRSAADARTIRVAAALDPAAADVSGDPDRLQQVVLNLLSNAVKFTPEGGTVTVQVQRSGAHARIRVSDTGRGISPEILPHIFERFRQGDSTATRAHGGLGLAIVRHLVELHGGSVRAESAGDGRGATLTVDLPLRVASSAPEVAGAWLARATEKPSPSAAPRLGGVRVLVVDDDPDTCELLSTVLRQDGADVVTAPSAQEALKTCERLRPDVLVTDISMPGEDGYDLLRQVRDLERRRRWRIPAVALTAHAQAEARDEAFSAGFKAYMAKPVEPADLTRAVAILSRRLDQS
jgi:signal transduction histidine kinase/ActR/RegA family two-component response regulator